MVSIEHNKQARKRVAELLNKLHKPYGCKHFLKKESRQIMKTTNNFFMAYYEDIAKVIPLTLVNQGDLLYEACTTNDLFSKTATATIYLKTLTHCFKVRGSVGALQNWLADSYPFKKSTISMEDVPNGFD